MPKKKHLRKSPWLKSGAEFKPLNIGRPVGGSSIVIQFFEAIADHKRWIGKSTVSALLTPPSQHNVVPKYLEEYLEIVGMKFYELLGVPTPQVVVSEQPIPEETINLLQGAGYTYNKGTKYLHIMSEFINDFHEYGSEFVHHYRRQKAQGAICYQVESVSGPLMLRGFGAAMAVANFIYDADCIGNSGGNIGYVLAKEQGVEYARTIKIDPGYAFGFLPGRSPSPHNPKHRDISIGTQIRCLHYDDLMEEDRKEFLAKIQAIISLQDEMIEELLKSVRVPHGLSAEHVQQILKGLCLRRQCFVAAFSAEINQRLNQMQQKLRVSQAVTSSQDVTVELAELNIIRAQVASFTLSELDFDLLNKQNFQLPVRTFSFIGRKAEIKQMGQFFTEVSPTKQSLSKRIYLTGMGGMGKSEIACHYAYLHRDNYQRIIWFHAEAALERQLQICAKTMFNITENLNLFLLIEKIQAVTVNQKVLWIFDNIEDLAQLDRFLINQINHHSLITTRMLNQDKQGLTIELSGFKQEEGLAYLQSALSDSNIGQEEERLTLLKVLDYYPLALVHAVSYINKGYTSLSEYPRVYLFHQLNSKEADSDPNYDTVKTSIMLSLRKINQEANLALTFLQYATCFPPENIQLHSMALLMKISLSQVQSLAELLVQH